MYYLHPGLIFSFLLLSPFVEAQSDIRSDIINKVIDPYTVVLNDLLAENSPDDDKKNFLSLFENNEVEVFRDFIGNNASMLSEMPVATYIQRFQQTWKYRNNVEDEVSVIIDLDLIYYCRQEKYLVYVQKSISGYPIIKGTKTNNFVSITQWVKITISDNFKIVSIEKASQPADQDGDHVVDACDECMNEDEPRYNLGSWGFNGCPDSDGDGLYDAIDCCPNFKGGKKFRGCPDEDQDNWPDEVERCSEFKVDECPGVKGTNICKGCGDSDGDGVCNTQDKCPSEKGNRKDGCPREKPPALFSIALSGGYLMPLERFGDYVQALDDNTGAWTNGSGFASPNFGAGISLDWTPSRFWGVGLTASLNKLPFRQDDLERQIKIFLAKNQVNYQEVVVSTSNNAYSGVYTGLKTMLGFFNDPWGIRLEPTAGWMITNFYKNSLSTRIDVANQPVETRALNLVDDNFFAWGGNLILTKSIERKWGISFYASYLQGQFSAIPGQLDFADQNSVLSFLDIQYRTLSLGLEIAYYIK
jgi:hypothetical protein